MNLKFLKYSTIILILSCFNLSFAQGYVFEDVDYAENYDSYSKSVLGFTSEIPAKFMLTDYVPPIGDQRNSGSCVAWAVGYYASSIIYNTSFGIRSSEGKWSNRFDPWFLYNQFSYVNDDLCEDGLPWSTAFDLAGRVGNKKLTLPPYDLHCSKEWSINDIKETVSITKKYKITKADYIDPEKSTSIDFIKTEISKYMYPVVIGISHYGEGLDNIGSDGIFKPEYNENRWGHAMTIVGYDDNVNGGSFLVVNSWGEDWGNNGYMWYNYKDFKKFTHVAWSIYVSFDKADKFNSDNYTRSEWDNGNQIYEGQVIFKENGRWSAEGYGINYNKELGKYTVGRWLNNDKDGKFYIVQNGKYRTEYWKKGIKQNPTSYGFANNEDDELESYVNSLFQDSEIGYSDEIVLD